nr:hypothetical protein GCM10025699_41670 [Microbacterium flavescens]
MSRIPEPETTPDGPAYEGRLLDRVDEEVVDQGVAFDLRTLVSRRGVLGILGLGAGSLALAACTSAAGTSGSGSTGTATGTATTTPTDGATAGTTTLPAGEIPDETAGPYPGDGSNGVDVLEQSGIVRSDIRSSLDGGTTAAGVPMTLSMTVLDMADDDAPFADVAVYVWHCDAAGGYSMYSDGIEDETYLRGVQVADATGTVSYTSIFPACYSGRWPHIHFEVYPDVDSITDSTNAISTSQIALPEDVCRVVYATTGYEASTANLDQVSLDSDNVFSDDSGALQLATVTGDATSGYQVSLTVRVDTSTAPTAGSAPGGGGGGTPPQAPDPRPPHLARKAPHGTPPEPHRMACRHHPRRDPPALRRRQAPRPRQERRSVHEDREGRDEGGAGRRTGRHRLPRRRLHPHRLSGGRRARRPALMTATAPGARSRSAMPLAGHLRRRASDCAAPPWPSWSGW